MQTEVTPELLRLLANAGDEVQRAAVLSIGELVEQGKSRGDITASSLIHAMEKAERLTVISNGNYDN